MSMLTGFIDAATRPTMSIFLGVLGTMAAVIRMTTPTHEISGNTIFPDGIPPR